MYLPLNLPLYIASTSTDKKVRKLNNNILIYLP